MINIGTEADQTRNQSSKDILPISPDPTDEKTLEIYDQFRSDIAGLALTRISEAAGLHEVLVHEDTRYGIRDSDRLPELKSRLVEQSTKTLELIDTPLGLDTQSPESHVESE